MMDLSLVVTVPLVIATVAVAPYSLVPAAAAAFVVAGEEESKKNVDAEWDRNN